MQFLNVRLYGKEGLWNVSYQNGSTKIVNAGKSLPGGGPPVDAQGMLLLPGFVNSHDHLDFNCFPQLGNGPYKNYREWGEDIHRRNAEIIGRIKRIPVELRTRWGMYKNLLNGFTTVVNHGERLSVVDPFIRVIQKYSSLHSVGFGRDWKRRLLNPFSRQAVVIHVGEGVDDISAAEIDELVRANVFRRKLIAVHGVAMKPSQAGSFAGLVWCPASNYFLFGRTTELSALAGRIEMVFGTDSTLTSPWNAWLHFQQALQCGQATEEMLVDMLTERAASLWQLPRNGDFILLDSAGDLFAREQNKLQLVVCGGTTRLIGEELKQQNAFNFQDFTRVSLSGATKWVYGNLPELTKNIQQYYPELALPFETE